MMLPIHPVAKYTLMIPSWCDFLPALHNRILFLTASEQFAEGTRAVFRSQPNNLLLNSPFLPYDT
jgi:hypothetical protein